MLPVHQPALPLLTSTCTMHAYNACVVRALAPCLRIRPQLASTSTTPASGLRGSPAPDSGTFSSLLFASFRFVSQATTNPNSTHTHTVTDLAFLYLCQCLPAWPCRARGCLSPRAGTAAPQTQTQWNTHHTHSTHNFTLLYTVHAVLGNS